MSICTLGQVTLYLDGKQVGVIGAPRLAVGRATVIEAGQPVEVSTCITFSGFITEPWSAVAVLWAAWTYQTGGTL